MSEFKDLLSKERSTQRLGEKTSQCLQMRDLYGMSTTGFTKRQHAHVLVCGGCRFAFNNFMKVKRNEARMHLKLPAWEDLK